ncbi:MAG: YdcF family protein [Nanoarchaeota archaeon]
MRIGILLGGGATPKGKLPLDSRRRADKAYKLLEDKLIDKLILSGKYSLKKCNKTEAQRYKEYLISKGVKPNKLIMEEQARETIGNAIYTKRLLRKLQADPAIYLITSGFHMDRAQAVFQHVYGRKHHFIPITSRTPIHHHFRIALWELIARYADAFMLSEGTYAKHRMIEQRILKHLPQYKN